MLVPGLEPYPFQPPTLEDQNDLEATLNPEGMRENYYPVPEDYTLGLTDEIREAASAEILKEVFPPEVVENWNEMSTEQKEAYLDQYSNLLGQALGVGPIDVIVEEMEPGLCGFTNGENGEIHLNADYINDPNQLADALNTVAHETRHCMQLDAIQNPEKYPDLPQELIDQWDYEFHNYNDGTYDPEGYANQYIETDARAFAEGSVERYLDDILP